MNRKLIAVTVLTVALVIGYASAKGGGHSSGYRSGSGHSSSHSSRHSSGHRTRTSSGHSGSRHYSHSSYHYKAPAVHKTSLHSGQTYHTAHYATGYVGARDANGRIVRSESARREFMRMTGYPHGRPGYVIDHVIPLKRGGPDNPSNMQWQTVAEAKAKDKWE